MTYEVKQRKRQELFRKSITSKGCKYILDDSESVEVLEPQELREEMKNRINNMFNLYINYGS